MDNIIVLLHTLPSWQDIHDNATKYGKHVTYYDVLKCVAVLLMTIDHIGYFFDPTNLWWRSVGRWCVPIWFFLVGYGKTFAIPPVLYWLAAILIVADIIAGEPVLATNILVTIMFARWFVRYMSTRDKDWFMVIIASTVCIVLTLPTMTLMEYGSQVWLYALAGYYAHILPGSRLATFTMMLANIFFCIMQIVTFGLTGAYALTMMLGVGVISVSLLSFPPYAKQPIPQVSALSGIIRYIGRNTHYYYAIHLLLFLWIAHGVMR